MKRIKQYTYSLLAFIIAAFSCEEDVRGPLAKDSIPPAPVSEVMVMNLPGGAKISYSIPDDEDALMVEAIYKLDNGKQVTSKSSIFKNFVLVEGLRKMQPQDVQLVTIDRSNNRSQPVIATINPETAPIDKLFSSFELVEDFGGVRLYFNNEDKIAAEILLYAADEQGNLVYSQSIFLSDDERSHHTFREFPPVAHKFGVSAIDRWDNVTEMLEAEMTPLEEIKLDLEKFRQMFLTGDEPNCCNWIMPYLWNVTIADPGFHTAHFAPGTLVPPYTERYHMFTMDLGVKAKLSRFKFWQRQRADKDGLYSHGNPRYFEVWGIDAIPADKGASLEGWTKLVENGEVVKPSGGPAGTNSAEDIAKAASGEEYDFPIEAPSVRYIRFVNLQNWAGTKFMFLTELNFWGQIVE
jgi:hypothetical protein